MNKSQYIRNTQQGLAQYYRAYTNQTTGDRKRMPVTADMIRKYHAPHAANLTIAQQAVYTAILIGFTAVARVSEYLQTPNATHLLTTDRVVFETDDGKLIPDQVYKPSGVRVAAATLHIKNKEEESSRDRVPLLLHQSPPKCYILHRPEPLGLSDTGSTTGSRKVALLHPQP
jgi:hypothetical protein